MNQVFTILGIAGSLQQLAAGTQTGTFESDSIPPFNQDEEANPLAIVTQLKSRFRAYTILFVTTEYNDSVPGVLKNAVDWAARPYDGSTWKDKVLSLAADLRFLNMHPINQPELMVGNEAQRFDENVNFLDEVSKILVAKSLKRLVQWVRTLQSGREAHPDVADGVGAGYPTIPDLLYI